MTHRHFSILLFLVFCSTFSLSFGQKDLIITQAGEEIRCKILDETPTKFKYAYLGPKKKVLRNEIFKNLVSSFKYSYFEEDILKNTKEIPRQQTSRSTSVPPRVEEPTPKSEVVKSNLPTVKPETPIVNPVQVNEPKVSEVKVPEAKVSKTIEPVQKTIEPSLSPVEPIVNVNDKAKDVIEDKKSKPNNKSKKENKNKKSEDKTAKPIIENTPKKIEPILFPEVSKRDSKDLTPKIESPKIEPTKKDEKNSKPEVITAKPNIETSAKNIESVVSPEVSKKDTKDLIAKIEPPKIQTTKKETKTVKVGEKKKTVLPSSEPPSEYKNHLKFRTGIKGGLGNLTTKIPETNPYGLYREKLQRGYNFGADFAFFPKESIGIGINYLSFQASNKSKDLDILNPITGENVNKASISNKTSYKFVGPSLLFRKSIDFKTFVVLGVSPGMYLYSDKGTLNETNFNIKGNAYGAAATLGLDFLIGNDIFGRDIILSIESGYNYGKITKLNYGAVKGVQSLSSPIDLSRLDFSVGLRFTRFPMYLR